MPVKCLTNIFLFASRDFTWPEIKKKLNCTQIALELPTTTGWAKSFFPPIFFFLMKY